MPRDRKQYNKDMTKQKIAFRNTHSFFNPKKISFQKNTVQQDTALRPIPTEQEKRD